MQDGGECLSTYCYVSTVPVALIKRTRIRDWGVCTSEVVADEVESANDLESGSDTSTENGMRKVDSCVQTVERSDGFSLIR